MALTDIEIANMALYSIGAQKITTFADLTEQARVMDVMYEPCRDSLLNLHPWNFAIKRVALTETTPTATPAYGYEKSFDLPTDCLRVLATDLDEYDEAWVKEGLCILTDEATINIKYISQITDPAEFSQGFIDAFVAKLAAEVSYKLVADAKFTANAIVIANEKLRVAKSQDAQEGRAMENLNSDAWINSRNTGLI